MLQGREIKRHERLIAFAIVIGILCGLASVALYYSLAFATRLLVNDVIGYSPTAATASGTSIDAIHIARPYLVPLIMVGAALIGGLISYLFSKETEGHGADAVILSFHRKKGYIRRRVAAIELVNASLTMGSGGSAGSEGPIALMCASLGSAFSRYIKLSEDDRRILSAVAVGSGIAAILKAPLGGALFGTEFLYRRSMEVEAIYPSLIASVISFAIYGAFLGYAPLFGSVAYSISINLFLFFIALGLASGILARVYVKIYHSLNGWFHHLKTMEYLKPAIGALFASAIILAFPQTLGEGVSWMTLMVNGKIAGFALTYGLPLIVFFLVLALLKIIATSFTVGSGASGGVFVPGLFIGGSFGMAIALIFHALFPAVITTTMIGAFAIVGMVSFFGATAKVPVSLIIVGVELVGSLIILPLILIAMFPAYLISGEDTIFRSQVGTKEIDKLVTPTTTSGIT